MLILDGRSGAGSLLVLLFPVGRTAVVAANLSCVNECSPLYLDLNSFEAVPDSRGFSPPRSPLLCVSSVALSLQLNQERGMCRTVC